MFRGNFLAGRGKTWLDKTYPLGGNYGLASFYPRVTVIRGKNWLPLV